MRNLKRITAVVLAMLISFSLVASAAQFSDVESGTTQARAVDLLTGLTIVGGYPDGTFGPERTITRAEFLKMLYVACNGEDTGSIYAGDNTIFPDVTGDLWYAPFVNWAVQLGIVGGYPDGEFKGDNPVTIAEAAKMIVVALGYSAGDYEFPYGYIDRAVKSGIFEEITGYSADNPALRGVVALMTYNFLFCEDGPKFMYWDTVNSQNDYRTPMEQVFGATSEQLTVVATSDVMPGVAGITAEGKVAYESKDGRITIEDAVVNCDDLIGHRVEVWSKTVNNKKVTLAVVDDTEHVYQTTYAGIQIGPASADANIKSLDHYITVDGVLVELYDSKLNASGETIFSNGSYDLYFWPSDTSAMPQNWVINGGASDSAFNHRINSWSQQSAPFNWCVPASFEFVEHEADSAQTRETKPWDKVYINYWKSGKVLSCSSAGITIQGINGSTRIPANRVNADLSQFSADDFVSVACTTKIVDGKVVDYYTLRAADMLKGRVVTGVTNRGISLDGAAFNLAYYNIGFENNYNGKLALSNFETGKAYDLVLDRSGYIVYAREAEGELPKYMMITGVSTIVGGQTSGDTYTVTGLLPDGATQTFNLVTSGSATVVGDVTGILDVGSGWLNAAGSVYDKSSLSNAAATSAERTVAAIGKVVAYTLDSDGQINSLEALSDADATTTYKYTAGDARVYKKTAAASVYTLDKSVGENTYVYTFDDNSTPYDYTDDEYAVKAISSFGSFNDATFSQYATAANDSGAYEIILMDSYDNTLGDDNTLAKRTYNYEYKYDAEAGTMTLRLQMIMNGACAWYDSVPVNVKNLTGSSQTTKVLREVTYSGSLVTSPASYYLYAELNDSNQFEMIYESSDYLLANGSNFVENPTSDAVSVFRAAIVGIEGNMLVLGLTNGRGQATGVVLDSDGMQVTGRVNVDGGYEIRNMLYYEETFALQVADDCSITRYNASTSSIGLSASSGTISDLNVSDDRSFTGRSYVVDFVLRHINNDASQPYEITQMIAYNYTVGNYSVVESYNTADANVTAFYDSSNRVSFNGGGTIENPHTAIFEIPIDNTDDYTKDWFESNVITQQAGATVEVVSDMTGFTVPAGYNNPSSAVSFCVTALDGTTQKHYECSIQRVEYVPTTVEKDSDDNNLPLTIYINPTGITNISSALLGHENIHWGTLAIKNGYYDILNPDGYNKAWSVSNKNTQVSSPTITCIRAGEGVVNVNTGEATLTRGAVYSFWMNMYDDRVGGVRSDVPEVVVRLVVGGENNDPGAMIGANPPKPGEDDTNVVIISGADANADGVFGDGGTAADTSFTPLVLGIRYTDLNNNLFLDDRGREVILTNYILNNITKGTDGNDSDPDSPYKSFWGSKSQDGSAGDNGGWVLSRSASNTNFTGTWDRARMDTSANGTVNIYLTRTSGNVTKFNAYRATSSTEYLPYKEFAADDVGKELTYTITIYNHLSNAAADATGTVTIRILDENYQS